ncbi:hypothetical protein BV20DRAFT_964096 [Pilatotrama ljubarskyi]|nr:hypothetical protein BV20DRAFT_964096 [Pilatotrama ljubarskyi]
MPHMNLEALRGSRAPPTRASFHRPESTTVVGREVAPSTGRSIPFRLAPLPELHHVAPGHKGTRHRIYVVSVSVGGETFELISDTGSTDLWVATSSLAVWSLCLQRTPSTQESL